MAAEVNSLRRLESTGADTPAVPVHGELLGIREDGQLSVRLGDGREVLCDWLENASMLGVALGPGDRVLVLPPTAGLAGVVLGRVARYRHRQPDGSPPAVVSIESSEALSIRCGKASVDLRADGKVMIRGEDVLVRAKGTQRIRAGTVAIN